MSNGKYSFPVAISQNYIFPPITPSVANQQKKFRHCRDLHDHDGITLMPDTADKPAAIYAFYATRYPSTD